MIPKAEGDLESERCEHRSESSVNILMGVGHGILYSSISPSLTSSKSPPAKALKYVLISSCNFLSGWAR